MSTPRDPEADAQAAGLRYVTDQQPGISRVRRGRGFSYHHPDGSLVDDAETRERIDTLAIPPAYREVWICTLSNGHLQATGRDERERKQYRYHPLWEEHRSRKKYSRMVPFGEALPTLRERVEADLRRRPLDLRRVSALAVALLDETLARIGNAAYAQQHGHYGLTTLRDRHAKEDGRSLVLEFTGKSGKAHALSVEDARLARLVKACRDIPGYDLFQYHTDDGKATLESGDVNAYLREVIGDFTAKDFRTWGGTVLAARALADRPLPEAERERQSVVAEAIREVASALGNTAAVTRSHYVHPDVLDAYRGGALAERMRVRNAGNTPAGLEPPEAAVLDLLRD
ncbi:MAG TPA: DNA topoisomerase IB [Bacteroidetes bacterium]|nr:DNA topoisomerase IB [Bacteroidota bacterium]HIL56318.1 DNA topoisomerase IB [Rhodothermales bacterium]